jgi:hypothetical protein
MRQPGLWRARMAAAVLGAALVAGSVVSLPAGAASTDEAKLLGLVNSVRASAGAPALALDDSLSAVARTWAGAMAAAGTISHNPALATQVAGWSKLAENVGMGPSTDVVHQALVASHSHYVNLTDTEVTMVGIGVVTSGNTVFVVEDFLQRAGAAAPEARSAPTTAAPTPPTTAAPAQAPAAARPATTAPPSTPVPTVPVPEAPTAAAPPPPSTATDPSPWLALAIELTRGWERASG